MYVTKQYCKRRIIIMVNIRELLRANQEQAYQDLIEISIRKISEILSDYQTDNHWFENSFHVKIMIDTLVGAVYFQIEEDEKNLIENFNVKSLNGYVPRLMEELDKQGFSNFLNHISAEGVETWEGEINI